MAAAAMTAVAAAATAALTAAALIAATDAHLRPPAAAMIAMVIVMMIVNMIEMMTTMTTVTTIEMMMTSEMMMTIAKTIEMAAVGLSKPQELQLWRPRTRARQEHPLHAARTLAQAARQHQRLEQRVAA